MLPTQTTDNLVAGTELVGMPSASPDPPQLAAYNLADRPHAASVTPVLAGALEVPKRRANHAPLGVGSWPAGRVTARRLVGDGHRGPGGHPRALLKRRSRR